MKRVMISLLGALAFAAAAQASEPQVAQPGTPAADSATATPDEAKKPDVNDRNCLRQTGSNISNRSGSRKDRKCTGATGRAYTQEDLQRTGEVNIADALRKLDPAIQ